MALARTLSLWHVVFYGVGLIVGAGIYAVIGEAAGYAGYGLWLSFLIAAIISAFTAFSYAELSTTFPKTGGSFYFVQETFAGSKKEGLRKISRLMAFIIAWLMMFQNIIGAAAVSLGFAGYLTTVLGKPDLRVPIALITLFFLGLLTYLDVRESTTLNALFTLIEVTGLLIVIALGAPHITEVPLFDFPSLAAVLYGTGLVYFAYLGFEDVAQLVEETKEPQKNIPRAILLALGITAILYVLVALAAVALLPPEELHKAGGPLLKAVEQKLGPLSILFAFIPLFSTFNTMFMLLIANARLMYGLAREGFIPKIFERTTKRTNVPFYAGFTSALLAIVFAALGDLGLVAGATDFGTFVAFALVNLSAVIVAWEGRLRGYKSPLTLGRLSLGGILGILTSLGMLIFFEPNTILVGSVVALLGIPYYLLYVRARTPQ